MKQMFAIVIVSAALVACGGKPKKTTLPENKGGATQTEVNGSSQTGANGGATYGGAMSRPSSGGTADPCGGD